MRLQGHRKRRRAPEVSEPEVPGRLSWTEYKAVRQYQTMGDLLDEFRVYGHQGAKKAAETDETDVANTTRNGHLWLTKDP